MADFIGDANLVDAIITDASKRDRGSPRGGRGAAPAGARPRRRAGPGRHPAGSDHPDPRGAERPSLPGRVVKAAYLGSHIEYAVTTDVGELFVIGSDVVEPLKPGAEAWLALGNHGVTLVPR